MSRVVDQLIKKMAKNEPLVESDGKIPVAGLLAKLSDDKTTRPDAVGLEPPEIGISNKPLGLNQISDKKLPTSKAVSRMN